MKTIEFKASCWVKITMTNEEFKNYVANMKKDPASVINCEGELEVNIESITPIIEHNQKYDLVSLFEDDKDSFVLSGN